MSADRKPSLERFPEGVSLMAISYFDVDTLQASSIECFGDP
jgi:hypothetical protein